MEFVSDKSAQKELIGKSIGDKVLVNPHHVSRGGKDTASMLGIKEEELSSISDNFQLTINEIKRMEMAVLDQDFFDKLFGPDAVSDEKSLKERITADLKGMFENDSDRLLTKTIYEDLLKNTKLNLPDAFLKRWIKLSNEKEISEEQIENEYEGYSKSLKWQLIQNELFKNNNIELNNDELIHFTKGLLINNFAQYGMPAPDDDELNASARKVLSNREEANRIYEMLVERKLTQFFKDTVRLSEKELSYEKFVELASN
jgi:trigger factor